MKQAPFSVSAGTRPACTNGRSPRLPLSLGPHRGGRGVWYRQLHTALTVLRGNLQLGRLADMVRVIVGRSQSMGNERLNAWTVSLLNVQPGDRILEIGCGPGVGIYYAAKLLPQGRVAGVDVALDMVRRARKRNLTAVRSGRAELLGGDAAHLPYTDEAFDKVFAVNCVPFWPRVVDNLKEVRRVLRPGGLVAVTLQPWWAKRDAEVARQCVQLLLQMVEAGFQQLRSEPKSLYPLPAFCVLGVKEPLRSALDQKAVF